MTKLCDDEKAGAKIVDDVEEISSADMILNKRAAFNEKIGARLICSQRQYLITFTSASNNHEMRACTMELYH